MDEVMSGAEVQEVAEPAMMDVDTTLQEEGAAPEAAVTEEEGAEAQEAAEPAEPVTKKDRTADATFAQMRRDAQEAAARARQLEAREQRLISVMANLGFTGANLDEVADKAVAHYSGRSIEDVKNERLQQARAQEEARKAEQLTQTLRMQNRELVTELVKNRMAEDLAKIQKLDPKVKSLDELGPAFGQLIRQGIPAERAYRVLAEEKKEAELVPPPKIGKVNAKTKAEKDFYTSEEVDKLTEAELDDPKIRAKVMKSMTRW